MIITLYKTIVAVTDIHIIVDGVCVLWWISAPETLKKI